MIRAALVLLAAGSVGTAAIAASMPGDKPVETLRRNGKWIVRFDDDRCMLLGQFGEGKKQVTMRIVNNGPGDSFLLSMFGDRLKAYYDRVSAKVDFGIGPPTVTTAYFIMSGETPGVSFRTMRIDGWEARKFDDVPPPVTPEREAAVTGVAVRVEGKPPFRLATGPLGKQFGLMRQCLDGLMQSWGYDPAVQNRLTQRPHPTGSPQNWLLTKDYPPDALRQGHNGMVEFRLAVDAEGKVEACHILEATEPNDFAKATCANLTRRAKFSPALDERGKPVRSLFVSSVNWQANP